MNDAVVIYEMNPLMLGSADSTPIVIQAFRIIATKDHSSFQLAGRDVTLFAHELILESPTIIDVSGAAGLYVPGTTPGLTPGNNGNNGNAGNGGGNGGKITICAQRIVGTLTLVADGGHGAAGQPGQDGTIGQPGTAGVVNNTGGTGSRGGRGGNGGNAGSGGQGGFGGSGGRVVVNCLDAAQAVISMSAAGGNGGTGGAAGAAGEAGPAGSPGGYWIYHPGRNGQPGQPPTWVDQGTDGPGTPGAPALSGRDGTPGQSGMTSQPSTTWTSLFLQAGVGQSDAYWSLVLDNSSQQYYNRVYPEAIETLAWIAVVLGTGVEQAALAPLSAATQAVLDRTQILVRQLKGGLDFYGNPQNYAQALSVETYETANKLITDAGKALDDALTQYTAMRNDQQTRLKAYERSISQAQQQIDDNKKARDAAIAQTTLLDSQIDKLINDQIRALARVQQVSMVLQTTLQGGGDGCSFSELMNAASLIITFTTGIPAQAAVISAAANDAFGPSTGQPSVAGLQLRIKDVQQISGTFKQIADSYNKIKASLPGATPDPSVDYTKVLLSDQDLASTRATIESNLRALPDSPDKDEYNNAVNAYLNIVQTRNQQLLAYDGLLCQISQADESTAKLSQQLDSLNSQAILIQTQDVTGVLDGIKQVRDGLVKQAFYQLLQHSRALDYWTLSPQDPPITVNDFGDLQGVLGDLVARRLRAQQNQGNPAAGFKTTPVPVIVALSASDRQQFAATGTYSFAITLDHPAFANYAQVLISDVIIEFSTSSSVTSPQWLRPVGYDLEHSGYHAFNDVSHQKLEFLTPPREILFDRAADGTITASGSFAAASDAQMVQGDKVYVGVSPFTHWTVYMHNFSPILGQSLMNVCYLCLTFAGTARPFNA